MRRILLHSIFWLVYLLQDTVLEFVWVGPALKAVPESVQFWMAFKAAIAAVLSKLLFTYFALYVAIKQLINGYVKLSRIMLQVAAAVII
ncbi:MAG TPA: hypothetical protein VM187_18220, partial [Niastella sp.]|nr:hypothetical protein [Niastella sp.]